MYLIYSICLFLALLVFIPAYFVKLRIFRGQKLYLRERLGFHLPPKMPGNKSLWIHAVSVGEVLSLQNLTAKIKSKHPDWIIHFSSLTNTGIDMAKKKLRGVDRVFFVPFDFRWIARRFFKCLEPDIFVLAESEFWPNLLRMANKHTRGVLLINGRVSRASWKRYSRIKWLIRIILRKVDMFLVQTDLDKARLESIGVVPDAIRVAGNLKAEIDLPVLSEEKVSDIKRELNISPTKKLAVAGSTHKGEEQLLLEAFSAAKQMKEDLLLILAPRHIERSSEIEHLADALSLHVRRRTLLSQGEDWDVLILDTLGELVRFYAISDVTFIGGSLVPWGGQNLLEPAFYSKPIFFGPHMDNFSHIAEVFEISGAAKVVFHKQDLQEMFLMSDVDSLESMGKKARATLQSLQGATEITLETIEKLMGDTG